MTLTTTLADPHRIAPLHDPDDETKLAQLIESMTATGYVGAPIVVIEQDGGDPQAVTGSHRIAAAREAGIDVPTVDVADLLAAHSVNLADLVAEYEAAGLGTDDARYEVIVRLDYHLPADVAEYYGLDAH